LIARVLKDTTEALILALIVFLIIQGSVRNFQVYGSSMAPTLDDGQYLLVNRLVYLKVDTGRLSRMIPFWNVEEPSQRFAIHPPQRGEVIVFRSPRQPDQDFVKRVVGLPGEEIEVRNGAVYIDGSALEEPYLDRRDNSNRAPIKLGEGEYFMMGDNRGNSNDSRTWGPLHVGNVRGKVWVVYWPFSALQVLDTATSLGRDSLR
jgi:signal peptidase I